MNATCATTESFYNQAVCYRCKYVGMEATSSRCPLCGFPLILETQELDESDSDSVEQIFHRPSVTDGAPPLPGIDGRPRKAQLLAEARERRISESRSTSPRPASIVRKSPRIGTGTTALDDDKPSALRVGLAVGGALVAGLAAAVIVHGGI